MPQLKSGLETLAGLAISPTVVCQTNREQPYNNLESEGKLAQIRQKMRVSSEKRTPNVMTRNALYYVMTFIAEFVLGQRQRKKSHSMSLHRHAVTSIPIRNNPCSVLPVSLYIFHRQFFRYPLENFQKQFDKHLNCFSNLMLSKNCS